MSPLDQKLLRDLWRMKTQALAIALVVATGVMLLVMMSGLVNSLEETRRAYYERYRLADVFAPVVRAPERVLDELAQIDGVSAVEGRISGRALIDVADTDLPVQARAVSLPDFGAPRLNDVYLTSGRLIDRQRTDEILLLKSFAEAHGLAPGDRLSATMHGARRSFLIVGLAQSPEFLYTTAPGELVPDDSRFGVIWMSRSAMEAAYDLDGAFNEALLSVAHPHDLPGVLAAADRLLDEYGALGAYALEDQFSNRFIMEEISGLRASAAAVPPIFLAVAAFLLNIVFSRLLQAERQQIGLIKAFGYTDAEVTWHYFKLILIITASGAALGCLSGLAAGASMVGLYIQYYKFPFLVFEIAPSSFVIAMVASISAAALGGLFALRRIFALSPAVAMRPPAPPDYSQSGRFAGVFRRLLDQPTRIVIRRLVRHPGRVLGAVAGVSAGMALSGGMLTILSGFDESIETSFSVVDRSDMLVSFIEPLSDRTIHSLRRIEGVIDVEPTRSVSVVLRNGVRSHRGGITALAPDAGLYRALDTAGGELLLPEQGIVLTPALADILDIAAGDILTVDVREGRRPLLQLPVTGIAESLLGSPAYMDLAALNRALGEPDRVSGAYLRVDPNFQEDIYTALDAMPAVAGVSVKADARAAFQEIMDEGAGSTRFVMAAIAAIIAFGIVYNTARIAYAESAHDLASLRVLGFTKGEAAFVLLGELGAVVLISLPIGALAGYGLTFAIAEGFSTDLYQIPASFSPAALGQSGLAVIAAAVFSGWMVKRDSDRADLVLALKSRE
ncbi:FtsX-like permease family protein [Hyphobacterium sp. HN65]|uniref:FtsX-like permease family protein n=1 Tax=Hyphobacterium lacteum TaxID=3116575 RepID=A0ABU7LTX5_9PROT|nr:FtsX-like permease family protein [Hyphobacterium sp. HN65]MEE2527372.1 FtsX-like permease family protein [Hyphobacterium sp. HN65]